MSEELFKKILSRRVKQVDVIGYVRVSTSMQVEKKNSLEAQELLIRQCCEEKEYNLLEIFRDEGRSGSNVDREGLTRALARLKPGMKLMAVDQSRIARKSAFVCHLIDELDKKDCSIYFINNNTDSEEHRVRLGIRVMAAVDEEERDKIRERVIRIMNYKAEEGTLTRKPRFGYKVVEGETVENEEEQELIKFIRDNVKNNPQIKIKELKKKIINSEFSTRETKLITNGYINKLIRDNNIQFEFKKTRPPYGWKVENGLWLKNENEQEIIGLISAMIKENPKITVSNITRTLKLRKIRMENGKDFYPGRISTIIEYNKLR